MPHSEGVVVQVEVDDHPVAGIVIWSIDIVASYDVEGDVVAPVIGGVTTSLVRVETVDHGRFMQGHFRADPGKQNLVNAQVVPGGIVIDLGGGIGKCGSVILFRPACIALNPVEIATAASVVTAVAVLDILKTFLSEVLLIKHIMGLYAVEFVVRTRGAASIPSCGVVHASREPIRQFAARVVADDDFMVGIRDQVILH